MIEYMNLWKQVSPKTRLPPRIKFMHGIVASLCIYIRLKILNMGKFIQIISEK